MTISSLKTGFMSDSFLAGNAFYVPPAFESIATVTAAGGETTLSFTSIPSTYVALQIRGISKNGTGSDNVEIRFNSDSGSNYSFHNLQGNGASVSATGSATQTNGRVGVDTNTEWWSAIIDIHDYASTSRYKTVRSFTGFDANGSGNVRLMSSLWQSTSAVTSIQLFHGTYTWTAGSTFALYGIKAAA